METDFTHIHCHSEYSLLDGMPRVEEYAIRCAELGYKALALTEHGNLRSMYLLQLKAKGKFDFNGVDYDLPPIKPIFGIEFYMTPNNLKVRGLEESVKIELKRAAKDAAHHKEILKKAEIEAGIRTRFHVLCFAKNQIGLQNLFKLNYLSWRDGFYYRPRIDMDLLLSNHEGIVITTSCVGGWAPEAIISNNYDGAAQWMKKAKGVFGDDLYVELQPHKFDDQAVANKGMIQMADEFKLKIIATNDCHYLLREDHESHDVMLAIQTQTDMKDKDRWSFSDEPEFYLKSRDEMIESFNVNHPYLSGEFINIALSNTMEIVDKCDVRLEVDWKKGILPKVSIPEEFADEDKYLTELCIKGWNWRVVPNHIRRYASEQGLSLKEVNAIYKARLNMELKRIFNMKFSKYFLIIWDIINWCRGKDIMVGPGRGSSAGSIVCWLAGITSIDPIYYNLLFDRFLNENRVDFPDVDMDFQDDRRDEVFQYIFDKYGEENCCKITTYGRMKGKMCLLDVGRVFNIPPGETYAVNKHIIERTSGDERSSQTVEDSFKEFEVCRRYNEKYPFVLGHVNKLEGKVRQTGVHAAGIQIADRPIHEIIPIEFRKGKSGKYDVKVSAFDWLECQAMGLVKIDVLGLKNLSILKDAQSMIEGGVDYDGIDVTDEKVLANFTKGRFVGIFQFDSIGMTKTCEPLTFKSFNDIIALTALYRPAAMRCIKYDVKVMWGFNSGNRKSYYVIQDLYEKWMKAPDCVKNPKRNFNLIVYDERRGEYVRGKIRGVCKSGIKRCYKFGLDHMSEASFKQKPDSTALTGNLACTSEHKMLTLEGWKESVSIKHGDYVLYRFQNNMALARRTTGNDFRNKAKFYYRCLCFMCGYDKSDIPLDVHHIDGDNKNHKKENLSWMCPNCHREAEYGLITVKEIKHQQKIYRLPNSYKNPFRWAKVLTVEYVGEHQTYDIEMESPYHSYIAGGIVVHNSGLSTDYIDRASGKAETPKMHPLYDEITRETYGALVYQEQMIRCFVDLAGYDPGTGDELRKKIAKKVGQEVMGKEKESFISGAMKSGVSKKDAESIFTVITFAGSYAFNKSHASVYSLITFWCMYLKTYHPTQFFYALMKHEESSEHITRFVVEARKMGVKVLMPDINNSKQQFSIVEDGKIICGLIDIKQVGNKATEEIIKCQPFIGFADFCERVDRRKVNKGVVKSLILAGAFKEFYPNLGALLGGTLNKKQVSVPAWERMLDKTPEQVEEIYSEMDTPEYELGEEEEVTQQSLVCPIPPPKHKIQYYDIIKKYVTGITPMDRVEFEGGSYTVMGVLIDIKYNNVGDFDKSDPDEETKKRIRWGARYANVNIEDETGLHRCKIDVDEFPVFRHIIDKGSGTPIMVKARTFGKSNQLFGDIMVDLDEMRDILREPVGIAERYSLMSPFEKYFLVHPTIRLREKVKSTDAASIENRIGTFKLIALICRIKRHWTKKNDLMYFMDVEDNSGVCNMIVWPSEVKKYGSILKQGSVCKIRVNSKGKKDQYFEEAELVEKIWELGGKSQ